MALVTYHGEIVHVKCDKYGDKGIYMGLVGLEPPQPPIKHGGDFFTVERFSGTNKRKLMAEINGRGRHIVSLDKGIAAVGNNANIESTYYIPVQ